MVDRLNAQRTGADEIRRRLVQYTFSLARVNVKKHGGRAHPDGSSGLGWSSKYGKYEG